MILQFPFFDKNQNFKSIHPQLLVMIHNISLEELDELMNELKKQKDEK
jgi:hypothetical protein